MDLINVIVPNYNGEKYLEECLLSVLEAIKGLGSVIVVDDGSNDNSRSILERINETHNNMKLIYQENHGYGSAVNNGLRNVNSNYIGIVESDDVVHPDMYKHLISIAESKNADVVKCGFCNISESSECIRNELFYNERGKVVEIFPGRDRDLFVKHHSIWSSIYRSSFLLNNDIGLFEGSKAFQDTIFAYQCYSQKISLWYVNLPFYYYRRFNQTNTVNSNDRLDDTIAVNKHLLMMLKTVSPELFCFMVYGVFSNIYWHANRLKSDNIEKFFVAIYEAVQELLLLGKKELIEVSLHDSYLYKYYAAIEKGMYEEFVMFINDAKLRNEKNFNSSAITKVRFRTKIRLKLKHFLNRILA